jgi:hypothetical protein
MSNGKFTEISSAFENALNHTGGVLCYVTGFALSASAVHALLWGLQRIWATKSAIFHLWLAQVDEFVAYVELFLIALTFSVLAIVFVVQLVTALAGTFKRKEPVAKVS